MTEFVDVPGGRIACDVTGGGPLVVSSHGIGDRWQACRFLAPVLAQADYRAASADLTRPSSSEPEPERNFGQLVKQAHRSFPTGVTVVTACSDGVPAGLAVNAFTSVSMDPPTVLVCVNSGSRSHPALCTARYLGISILSREQSGVAMRFAISGGDKFSDIGDEADLPGGTQRQADHITLHDPKPGEAWDALRTAAAARNGAWCKWVIALDDDVDAEDLDSVLWALSFRVQPHRDVQTQRGRNTDLDPSGAPVDDDFAGRTYPDRLGGSQILIDATRAWAYPPVSLPSRDLMENARTIWEELKLPELTPRVPWHGYELGYWPDSWSQAAKRAGRGEYLKTGEEFRKYRTLSSYYETGKVVRPEAESA